VHCCCLISFALDPHINEINSLFDGIDNTIELDIVWNGNVFAQEILYVNGPVLWKYDGFELCFFVFVILAHQQVVALSTGSEKKERCLDFICCEKIELENIHRRICLHWDDLKGLYINITISVGELN